MKSVRILALLFILFKGFTAQAQPGTPKFLSIGLPSNNERATAIYVKNDGSYYVGGLKNDSALVMYMSNTDTIIWAKTFKFAASACYVNYLSMSSDGSLIGTAYCYTSVSNGCCFKINAASGTFIWNNTFNGNNLYFVRIIEKNANEYICIGGEYPGVTPSVGVDAKNTTVSASTGNIISQSSCIGLASYNWLDDLEGATDMTNGNFYSTGRSYLQNLPAKMRSHLFKYNPQGNIIWSKYLHKNAAGTSRMYSRDMIMVGQTQMLILYISDEACAGACTDYFPGLLLADTSGTVIWDKVYNIPASNAEYVEKVNVMGNSIYISGYTNINGGNNNVYVLKTDMTGNVQNCRQFGSTVLNEKNFANNVCTAGDYKNGLFYFVYSAEGTNGFSDINIMKLDSTLNIPCYPSTALAATAITVTPYQTAYPTQPNNGPFTTTSNNTYITKLANACPSSALSRITHTINVAGVDTVLSVFSATATSYFWNNSATTHSLYVNSTQVDSVLVSSGCCPAMKHVFYVSVCDFSITITGTASICSGQSNTLTASGAFTYTWQPGGIISGSLAVSPNATTIYTVSGTNAAGCLKIKTFLQQVVPSPTLAISPGTPSICAGSSVTLIASGAASYTWQPGNTTMANLNVSPSSNTTYTLYGNNNSGCQASATTALIVAPLPTVSIAGSNTVCAGNNTTLTAGGAAFYTWQPGGASGPAIAVTPAATTIYTVTGTSAAGCTGQAAHAVNVAQPPAISFTSNGISCAALGSATVTATGIGPYSYTWNPTAQTGPIATNLYPNTYTLSVKNNSTGCTYTTTTTFTSAITGTVSSGGALCNGVNSATTSITLSGGSGAYTYSWTNVSGPQTFSVATNLNAGIHSVTVTDALTFCSLTTTFQVTQPTPLVLAVSASTPNACTGTSVVLTATNSGGTPGYTYTWTAGPSTSTHIVSTVTGGSYVYTVTSRDVNNCVITDTISINFLTTPTLAVSNTTACFGATATLIASGANTYTWYPANVSGSAYNAAPAVTTGYTVTGASAGCTSSATATVIVNQPPLLSFNKTAITCASLGSATVSASGGIGPFSYSWSPTAQTNSVATGLYPETYTISVLDNGTGCTSISTTTFVSPVPFTGTLSSTSSITCNGVGSGTAAITLSGGSGTQSYLWDNQPGAAQTTAIATSLYDGVHTVTVTDALTFCKVIQSFTITSPPALILNVTASSPTACTTSTITLTAFASGGTPLTPGPAYNYSWLPGPATAINAVSFITAGAHIYTITSNDSFNCAVTKTISVSFVTTPTVSVSNASICLNVTATLTASGAAGYSWLPGGTFGSTHNVSPAVNTTYTVTGNSAGCVASATAFVTVYPLPVPAIATSPTVCSGQNISLSGSGSGTYIWSGPGGFSSVLQNPVINSVNNTNTGTYHLLVTSANNCTASTSSAIAVLNGPPITVSSASVCIGEAASLHASGGTNYQWSGPSGFLSTQPDIFIPIVNASLAGNYTVIVTNTINACPTLSVVPLVGYPYPLPNPTITAKPTACINAKVSLAGSGGDTYAWHGPAGFASQNQNATLNVSGLNMSGIYTLSVKNNSNCAASATVMITVYPQPKGTLYSNKLQFCVPACSDFKFKPAVNIAPVTGHTFQVNGQNFADTSLNYCFKNAGNYIVNVSYKDSNACVNTASLLINAFDKPSADFDFFPASPIAKSDNVLFTNASTGAAQISWYWFFDNLEDTVKAKSAYHTFENTGDYPVAMIVKNKWGCADTMVKVLNIGEEFSLYVPNAFTPNGDNINDTFQPKGVGITNYNLQVFDRWGEKLFDTKDFYTGWDGSFKGKSCTDDIYIWKINVEMPGGKARMLNGYVNLIR